MKTENTALRNNFITACQEGVAEAADVASRRVVITLAAGSVQVTANITASSSSTASIKDSLVNADLEKLLNNMVAVPDIGTVLSKGEPLTFIGSITLDGEEIVGSANVDRSSRSELGLCVLAIWASLAVLGAQRR